MKSRESFFKDLTRKNKDGVTEFNCSPHNVWEWFRKNGNPDFVQHHTPTNSTTEGDKVDELPIHGECNHKEYTYLKCPLPNNPNCTYCKYYNNTPTNQSNTSFSKQWTEEEIEELNLSSRKRHVPTEKEDRLKLIVEFMKWTNGMHVSPLTIEEIKTFLSEYKPTEKEQPMGAEGCKKCIEYELHLHKVWKGIGDFLHSINANQNK